MYRTILVPLDGSLLAERALPYAHALAEAGGARVILLRVVPEPGILDEVPAGDEEKAMRDAEAYLAGFAAQSTDRARVVTEIYRGSPVEVIVEEVQARRVDVVVMSTHGRSGLSRWIYGSVADGVLRSAAAPVLLVPTACRGTWPVDHTARILVPLDGSPLAEDVLAPVSDLAEALGAEMLLLRVVQSASYPYASGAVQDHVQFDLEAEIEHAQRYLDALADKLRARGRVVKILVTTGGDPALEIISAAREQSVDVIAIATHGRGGVVRVVLGSVASGVVQRATVPVLISRPAAVPSDTAVFRQ